MSTASIPSSSPVVYDSARMSRRELQAALRSLKLPSGGTNDALRLRLSSYQQGSAEQSSAALNTTHVVEDKPEERRKPFRASCPHPTLQRIERAKTQTMYLVTKDNEADMEALCCNFVVLGSTGNVYNVIIQRVPRCNCPDHTRGHLCKHILFVLLKVMRVPADSPLIYQTAWIDTELREMFEGMRDRFMHVSGGILASRGVQETYAKLKSGEAVPSVTGVTRRTDDDDCPICFDTLGPIADTTYCRSQCGANFHKNCIRHWLTQKKEKPSCPMCRGPWEDDTRSKTPWKQGYTNLGCLQGNSPEQDTSALPSHSIDHDIDQGHRKKPRQS